MQSSVAQPALSPDEQEKLSVLNKSELDDVDRSFSVNALRVLASRYLLRDARGNITETPAQLFERVATLVAIPDLLYGEVYTADKSQAREAQTNDNTPEFADKVYESHPHISIGRYPLNRYHFRALVRAFRRLERDGNTLLSLTAFVGMMDNGVFAHYEEKVKQYAELMSQKVFLPNTPTLMNAGARLGQLSACFVLDMPDDMSGIMKTSSDTAMIFKSGGGVGINYSKLRQKGDIVASTSGVASGPVSFMSIIDTITNVVKQGGKRRGANMGILDADHPDIEEFIAAKRTPGVLENFNVSVAIPKEFWRARAEGRSFWLINRKDKSQVRGIDPDKLLDAIAESAWASAEPGVVFLDNVNGENILRPARGEDMRATNPCGEQSLYPYESCNLGSINLAKFVNVYKGEPEFDWPAFESAVRTCTQFLDNIIDVNNYPIPEIERASIETRRIGLGVMGLADMLFLLGVKYDSEEALEWMGAIAEALTFHSMRKSVALAGERGAFGLFNDSAYPDGQMPVAGFYKAKGEEDWETLSEAIQENGIRNCVTTTVAPTGSLSMIADCSNGIEPAFALVYEKRVSVGRFFYTNDILKDRMMAAGQYSERLLGEIAERGGSLQNMAEVPDSVKRVFVTAMDISWRDHVKAQAAWQMWIANAISKTINMPEGATAKDVKDAYVMAHELGLKGVTVFRDHSRQEQVLHGGGRAA
jgi:ribonucleoside-diphosphate reductase alpha chain